MRESSQNLRVAHIRGRAFDVTMTRVESRKTPRWIRYA